MERYRGLWRVEAAFRANKHDLRMRPIFHWKKRRIEAHVAICFLAYSVSYALKAQLEAAGLNWSIERIREVLKEDQRSIVEDKKTGRRYKFFGHITPEIQAVYRAFQLIKSVSDRAFGAAARVSQKVRVCVAHGPLQSPIITDFFFESVEVG